MAKYPNVVYPVWDRTQYAGGAAEHTRLAIAMALHKDAALRSASWGMFQIMGFNHKLAGYSTVSEMVTDYAKGEAAQLLSFLKFITARGLARHLVSGDYAAFARGYNGAGYAQNQYDVKIKAAVEKALKEGWSFVKANKIPVIGLMIGFFLSYGS
jgi:hypothetical protein